MSKPLISTREGKTVVMELIILGIFAIVGVFLLKFLVGAGDISGRLPPPPSPYMGAPPMPGYGYYNPPPATKQPRVIKRKVIIMPEKTVRRHTKRKRRLRT